MTINIEKLLHKNYILVPKLKTKLKYLNSKMRLKYIKVKPTYLRI